jgi:hypothetical protein
MTCYHCKEPIGKHETRFFVVGRKQRIRMAQLVDNGHPRNAEEGMQFKRYWHVCCSEFIDAEYPENL